MKMTASFLALACAATLPLASVAHAATSESATMVSAAQSQTILEVSASGKLSEIGAAVLGPDVRLTVRLHGPIAFDVDTANFASLEIYADDVKCSHGATVGQLDDNALFYMRQRGIAEREARLLLMFAFVNEVIDEIRLDALKDRLHLLVEKRFRGELNKCQGCAMCK